MEELLVWAIVLLVIGMGLAFLEIFFPSGGILGFLCVSSVIASIIMAFMHQPLSGLVMLGTSVVVLPVILALALKWWPKTAIGRRVLLAVPKSEDVAPDHPKHRALKKLVDRVGVAKSEMLPSGAVVIDGKTISAVSEGMAVEAGQRVRVIEVRGNRVVVRPLEEEAPSETEKDPLARPIETILDDPFDETPA